MFASQIGLICLVAFISTSTALRMVGGHLKVVVKARFAVKLVDENGGFFCSGTLVSPQHVVTAAHCLNSFSPKQVFAVSGIGEEKRAVDQWFIPSEFSSETLNMDIAVLKLHTEMSGKHTAPARLCSKPVPQHLLITVFGWGQLFKNGPLSEDLHEVRTPVMARDECVRQTSNVPLKITESMLCAYKMRNGAECYVDGGSAAIVNGELCGLASGGSACDVIDGGPSIYTDVFVVRKFIEEAMKN